MTLEETIRYVDKKCKYYALLNNEEKYNKYYEMRGFLQECLENDFEEVINDA